MKEKIRKSIREKKEYLEIERRDTEFDGDDSQEEFDLEDNEAQVIDNDA